MKWLNIGQKVLKLIQANLQLLQTPRWYEIAEICQQGINRHLNQGHQLFQMLHINDRQQSSRQQSVHVEERHQVFQIFIDGSAIG